MLRYRRVFPYEFDLILREAGKYGELRHEFFGIVEGNFKDVYAVNDRVWKEIENLKLKPYSFGTFVGVIKTDRNLVERFYPNVEFFYFVNISKNYAILKPRSAFLFTTGRDIPKEGIKEYKWERTRKLVILDKNWTILGIGVIQPRKKAFIKNITDIGKFIRRRRR